ncbi:MAG: hypothetical protein LBB78_02785 [Spirochaetaceae bacterium]|nr:hypothetical protein [Spirochaetaceae bacterium]
MNFIRFITMAIVVAGMTLSGCSLPIAGDLISKGKQIDAAGKNMHIIADYNLLSYIPVPAAGARIPRSFPERADLEITVRWKDFAQNDLNGRQDFFAEGALYCADITLTAKKGWMFDPAISFYYPNNTVIIQPAANLDPDVRRLGTIQYLRTDAAQIVSAFDMAPHISKPKPASAPAKSFIAPEALGIITWEESAKQPVSFVPMSSPSFQKGISYQAVVTLYPTPDYTFSSSCAFPYPHGSVQSFNYDFTRKKGVLIIRFPPATL